MCDTYFTSATLSKRNINNAALFTFNARGNCLNPNHNPRNSKQKKLLGKQIKSRLDFSMFPAVLKLCKIQKLLKSAFVKAVEIIKQ